MLIVDDLMYTVRSGSMLLLSEDERQYFGCNETTPLNKRLSLDNLDCTHESIVYLQSRLGKTNKMHAVFRMQ